nr:hypothetical protein [Tanacetum cinerariifolium]
MEAQSELSLETKSLVICAHKWRKSTTKQTLPTEIITIVVDTILKKPVNCEGESIRHTQKFHQSEHGRIPKEQQ